MRVRDWRLAFVFLLIVTGVEFCFSASTLTTPILPHKDPNDQAEFQHAYQTISHAPSIFTGAGAPGYSPQKVGDIYISTTTQKVYISTATLTSGSWVVVN